MLLIFLSIRFDRRSVVNIGAIAVGNSTIAGAFDVLMCLYISVAMLFGGKALKKMLMPKDMAQQGSDFAKANAEKIYRVAMKVAGWR